MDGSRLLGNMGSDRDAGVAHSVERNLAKVEVAGSKPVSRSNPFLELGTRSKGQTNPSYSAHCSGG